MSERTTGRDGSWLLKIGPQTRMISKSISWSTCMNFWSHSSISVVFLSESLSSSAEVAGSFLWCSHYSRTLRRTASLTCRRHTQLGASEVDGDGAEKAHLHLARGLVLWNSLIANILEHVLHYYATLGNLAVCAGSISRLADFVIGKTKGRTGRVVVGNLPTSITAWSLVANLRVWILVSVLIMSACSVDGCECCVANRSARQGKGCGKELWLTIMKKANWKTARGYRQSGSRRTYGVRVWLLQLNASDLSLVAVARWSRKCERREASRSQELLICNNLSRSVDLKVQGSSYTEPESLSGLYVSESILALYVLDIGTLFLPN